MEHQDPECVDIGRDGRWLAGHKFGSHIARRTADFLISLAIVRETEIHQQNPAALFAHSVAGFNIAVQESGGMHGANGFTQIDDDVGGFHGAERTLRRQ